MSEKLLREDFRLEPASCYVDARCPRYKAIVPAEEDLSPLMPYLNAVARVVFYDPEEPVLVFKFDGRKVAVRKNEVRISDVPDIEEGRRLREKVAAYLEEVWTKRAAITPRHEPRTLPPALKIYQLLPKTNCGKCGEATCLAFAAKLSTAEADLSACRPLFEEEGFEAARKELEKLLNQ